MNFCWLVIPVLFVGVFFHFLSAKIIASDDLDFEGEGFKLAVVIVCLLLSVPALLFAAASFHLFDEMTVYHTFRSLPFVELSVALLGLFTGCITGSGMMI